MYTRDSVILLSVVIPLVFRIPMFIIQKEDIKTCLKCMTG